MGNNFRINLLGLSKIDRKKCISYAKKHGWTWANDDRFKTIAFDAILFSVDKKEFWYATRFESMENYSVLTILRDWNKFKNFIRQHETSTESAVDMEDLMFKMNDDVSLEKRVKDISRLTGKHRNLSTQLIAELTSYEDAFQNTPMTEHPELRKYIDDNIIYAQKAINVIQHCMDAIDNL